MTSDKPPPSPQDQPRRTMSPTLRRWLQNPIFQKNEHPQSGGIVITGVGPQSPPPQTQPAGTEPPQPEPEAEDGRR